VELRQTLGLRVMATGEREGVRVVLVEMDTEGVPLPWDWESVWVGEGV